MIHGAKVQCASGPARLEAVERQRPAADHGVAAADGSERSKQFDDGVEVVTVATPNFSHYEITKAALNAGLHAICEKPLFFTTAEVREVKSLADAKGLIVGVTYGFSGHPLLRQMRAMIANGEIVRHVADWLPQYGLRFHLRMDGYAWLFAMLVTFMGALVVIYARYYMSPADPVPRFFSFLLAFMGAMVGMVLSGNLIQLVVFWELTSLTSFMLIAYWYHLSEARHGARTALTVTAMGGLCLLAGVIMLGEVAGSYDLDQVLASGDLIRAHPWYPAILILVLLGALTKSAQFPFHFWLPHAMAAPTPVSAYLHSATMVKAGVFLLARLWPVLSGTDLWFWIVSLAGLSSLLLGAFAAIFQRDMKGVLAYSTISHLGLVTLLLGMNTPLALGAAVFHMMNHATFKASLFMAAGIVDHGTGTRDLQRLSGLSRAMPITATLATVAAAAMAGVPLLNGFLSKEMFFAETMFAGEGPLIRIGLPALATIAGMFSVAYSLRLVHQVFFGPVAEDLPRVPHEPTRGMLLPSALLVLACLLVGIFPEETVGSFLRTATYAILGEDTPSYNLAVWHGLTLPLVMSIFALGGGFVIYLLLYLHRRRAHGHAPVINRFDGRRTFDVAVIRLIRLARLMRRTIASRRLQTQLVVIVSFAFIAAWVAADAGRVGWGEIPISRVDPIFALLWLVGSACAIGAAHQAKYHRLAALIMVGGVGLLTCLTFAWFSAPDLALTQITVNHRMAQVEHHYVPSEDPMYRRAVSRLLRAVHRINRRELKENAREFEGVM